MFVHVEVAKNSRSVMVQSSVKKTIAERVKELNLPFGEYVVVGGAMEAFGIRKANDIDVVVSEDLFNELVQKGEKGDDYRVCNCEDCEEIRQTGSKKRIIKREGVEIISEYSWKNAYRADTDTLIKNAHVIEGVPFVQLEELLKWKKAANREKDKKDVVLIEQFLLGKKQE